ncbi:hypothetical protein AB0K16_54430 [Nonomuraea jabiensis]|uniref:hypothetical protein n=1 Tax=Nonomuraea jabiensis TaxID=882448 RepID=UPI0034230955
MRAEVIRSASVVQALSRCYVRSEEAAVRVLVFTEPFGTIAENRLAARVGGLSNEVAYDADPATRPRRAARTGGSPSI